MRIEFFGLRLILPIREPIDLHALFFDQEGIDQRFPVTTPDHDVLVTLADLHGLLVHSVISHQSLYPKVKKVPITNQRHGIGLRVDQGIVRVLPNQLEPISILNQGWRTGLIKINSFQAQFCHFTSHNIVCMSLASSRKPDTNYSLHPVHLVRSNRYRSVDTQVFFISIGKNWISRTLRITKSHLGGVITFVKVRGTCEEINEFVFEERCLDVCERRGQNNLMGVLTNKFGNCGITYVNIPFGNHARSTLRGKDEIISHDPRLPFLQQYLSDISEKASVPGTFSDFIHTQGIGVKINIYHLGNSRNRLILFNLYPLVGKRLFPVRNVPPCLEPQVHRFVL